MVSFSATSMPYQCRMLENHAHVNAKRTSQIALWSTIPPTRYKLSSNAISSLKPTSYSTHFSFPGNTHGRLGTPP
jgi:hypothetical protein